MRVLKKPDFLKLPEGVAYCRGKKWFFGGLAFKGETVSDVDWYELEFNWVDGHDLGECFERMDAMLTDGVRFPIQDSICRNGLYEDDDLFLVFDEDDLLKLRGWIDDAIRLSRN